MTTEEGLKIGGQELQSPQDFILMDAAGKVMGKIELSAFQPPGSNPGQLMKLEFSFFCPTRHVDTDNPQQETTLAEPENLNQKAESLARELHLLFEEKRKDVAKVLNGRHSSLPYYSFDQMPQADRWMWAEVCKELLQRHQPAFNKPPADAIKESLARLTYFLMYDSVPASCRHKIEQVYSYLKGLL